MSDYESMTGLDLGTSGNTSKFSGRTIRDKDYRSQIQEVIVLRPGETFWKGRIALSQDLMADPEYRAIAEAETIEFPALKLQQAPGEASIPQAKSEDLI